MVAETPQVTGLGQDRQGVDRPDAGDHTQELIIAVRRQRVMGNPLDLVALLNQGACLGDNHTEHGDRRGIFVDRQRDRCTGRLVNVVDYPGLGNLAADQRPDLLGESLAPNRGDAARRRESFDQRQEPVGPAIARETLDLREIQRQIMGEDPMPGLGLRLGNGFVGLRHLLQIVDARSQRIDIALRRPDLQHMQDYLRVLGIILVPAIVQRFACPGQGDRRNQAQLEPGGQQAMRQRAVIVAGCFKADDHGPADGRQIVSQPVIVRLRRHDGHTASAAAFRSFEENFLAVLRHIDGYQDGVGWRRMQLGHDRSASKGCVDNFSLETCWPVMTALMKPAGATRPCPHQGIAALQ